MFLWEMDVTSVLHNFQLTKAQKNHHHDQIPSENTSAQFAVRKVDFFFFKANYLYDLRRPWKSKLRPLLLSLGITVLQLQVNIF